MISHDNKMSGAARIILLCALLCGTSGAAAGAATGTAAIKAANPAANPAANLSTDTLRIESFRLAGITRTQSPYIIDSLDNNGKAYNSGAILDGPGFVVVPKDARCVTGLPAAGSDEVCTVGFTLENREFTKGSFLPEGIGDCSLRVDGKVSDTGKFNLDPGTHEFVLSYTGCEAGEGSVSIALQGGSASVKDAGDRLFSLDINTIGSGCSGVDLSPSGKYVSILRSLTAADGKRSYRTEILRTSDSRVVSRTGERINWLAKSSSDEYYFERTTASGRELVCSSPESALERVLCADLPEGRYTVAPDGSFLIYSIVSKGPKEGSVHQILNPEDRQSGYRDRTSLAKFDPATGLMQPLTFGYHDCSLVDISCDGSRILFSTIDHKFGPRPTELHSLYVMDLATMQAVPVVDKDGFAGTYGCFSPDGQQIAVVGSAESFGRVGCTLDDAVIPNEYDFQLYTVDIASGRVTPLCRDFAPSVQSFIWSRADGMIYLSAQNGDRQDLFRIDPATAESEPLGNSEEYVMGFSTADSAPLLAYFGESLENFSRVYTIDTRRMKEKLLVDFSAERLAGVRLGEGGSYSFTSSRGDLITAFYVLPPDFDPQRKYPMIVHYYGGCYPTTRYCVGSYSPQLYAAQGYVFLAVNPSGAAGFGQEFASRHVNTAGEGVVDDIIECVQNFCASNSWVDASRIGCFSASYGGFITQLLLERTDIFATGISHAGISSHTSYWGEGYYGYTYSEVAMAGNYPWNNKELYVNRSTLYNADKLKTPILFLHGSADTNVPVGESIQMFTAMTLLGTETAFVMVDGENHGISDFGKKRQWLRTISAWFAKYLKDDSSWWDELYPPKTL